MEKKPILSLIALLFFISAVFLWSDIYLPLNPNSNKMIDFIVQKGKGAKEISIDLKKQGLIKHTSTFRIYVLLSGRSQKLQAGQYELSQAMNVANMVKKIAHGEIVKKRITIIEGWNLKDIAQYFESQGICTEKEFFDLAKRDFSQGLSFLDDKPNKMDLEGYFFPDTYEIISGAKAEDITKKVLSNFDEKLTLELRAEISRQKKTIFEIVTMASIIEKEVKTLKDKKIVSGILWKRLKTGMPLQSCATINYITGKNDSGALFKDIEIDSPYNTYKYTGLPAGPISNPGLESIIAAIYLEDSDYWYYLSTKGGKTIFSKTFKEHNAAIAKYLQ